ncbi:MAG: ROK family protein [Candidatus Eremiobacteraeota bacterium]|nr:ROK family protein [Candidatus Eremiobacteraeota bacterium]
MLGGIEGGGTKFVCGFGTGPDDLTTAEFPTSTPDITLANVLAFFKANTAASLSAVGIGSFGPVDLDPASPSYGHITSTPKAGWEDYNVVSAIEDALGVPAALDTDVNVALLGEARWGAARGLSDAVYLTIGTGVGGAALVHGKVVHGLLHPEIGHLHLPHDRLRDPFPGRCPYHADCLEGLAAGPAMQARWGAPAGTLPADHPAWELEAHYLALALVNLTVTLSPRRILLGGGVMQQSHLFPLVRAEFSRLLNNYIRRRELTEDLDQYIQPPQLRGRAGVLGGLVLAEQAARCPR